MDQRQGFGLYRQNKCQRDNDEELFQRVPKREMFANNSFVLAPAIDPFSGQGLPSGVPAANASPFQYSNPQNLSSLDPAHIPALPMRHTGYPQFESASIVTTQPSTQQIQLQKQAPLHLPVESRSANQFALRSHFRGQNTPKQTPELNRAEREKRARFNQDARQWGGITKPATDGQKQLGEKCLTCIADSRECDGDQLINDSCAGCARVQRRCLWRDPTHGIFSYQDAQTAAAASVRLEQQVQVTRNNMATEYDPFVALTNLGSDRAEMILKRAATELFFRGAIGDDGLQNTQNLYIRLRATSERKITNGNDQDQWAYVMLMNILDNGKGFRLGLEKAFVGGWVDDYVRKYGHASMYPDYTN